MNNSDCIFCRIASKAINATIVYEDDQIIAIQDVNPVAPVHILLIPKTHIESLNQVDGEQVQILGRINLVAAQLAKELGIAEAGYRLINNCGVFGGQSVLHLHYHLLGGRELAWPPG
ncbi:MAG: histidine triad nucleotide-binding protein [Syntrophomonadaceae bacterium]|nr:histidine triad nucleotide-binding protein [Syntrophomonadaceae bacterium]